MIENIYQLIDLITGYQPAAVVSAANRIGLFRALSAIEPRTVDVLASDLGAPREQLAKLVSGLEAVGLVTQHPDGFLATEFTATELTSDMAKVVEKEAYFARVWNHLAESILSGRPLLDPWQKRLISDPDQALQFLEALDVLARRTGPPIASISELAPGKKVLDIGGGLGTYTRQLAEAGSEVVLVDLEPVTNWASDRLFDLDVSVVVADVFRHDSCGVSAETFDAALVSHLIHDLKPDRALDLLRRAARTVTPGGHVVVNDFVVDGPDPFGPLFDLMMSVETGGNAYPLAELMAMMREAGLENVYRCDFGPPVSVLIGEKA